MKIIRDIVLTILALGFVGLTLMISCIAVLLF